MIADAIAAAEQGDWGACLTALLEVWHRDRQPALGDLIERVAERILVEAIEPTAAAIAEATARATDADVTMIAATIRRQCRTQPSLKSAAARLPADPRGAALLAELFERSPFARTEAALDREILDGLEAIDDPRYRPLIIAAADRLAQHRRRIRRQRASLDHLVEVAGRVRTRPPPPAVTTDLSAIDRALAPRGPGDRDALLAAIVAAPASTSARLIYADLLQDAGDPRGEFITLQCNGGSAKRERELLKLYERPWLGELDPLLRKSGLVYRRGFVAAGRLAVRGFRAPPSQPDWQTLEELDLCEGWGEVVTAWLPTLGSLRRVAQLYCDDLRSLRGPLPWTSVGLRYADEQRLSHLPALPDLVELDFTAMDHLAAVGAALRALAKPVERIRLVVASGARGELNHLGMIWPHARELELAPKYEFIPEEPSVILRGDHATFVQRRSKLDTEYAIKIVQALPPDTLRT
ncbi:MAG: TIGR02996 domain-containing protein, partial [Kofleriaceae bacterium]